MHNLVEYMKFNSNKIYYNVEYYVQNSLISIIEFIKSSDEYTLQLLNLLTCALVGGCLNLYTSLIIGFYRWGIGQFLIFYVMSFILGFIIGIFNTVLFILIKKSNNPVDWLISIQELRQQNYYSSFIPVATNIIQVHEHTEY